MLFPKSHYPLFFSRGYGSLSFSVRFSAVVFKQAEIFTVKASLPEVEGLSRDAETTAGEGDVTSCFRLVVDEPFKTRTGCFGETKRTGLCSPPLMFPLECNEWYKVVSYLLHVWRQHNKKMRYALVIIPLIIAYRATSEVLPMYLIFCSLRQSYLKLNNRENNRKSDFRQLPK